MGTEMNLILTTCGTQWDMMGCTYIYNDI